VKVRAGWLVLLLVLAALLAVGAAHAVVFVSGDGTGNATPPPDDFGFAHVGVAAGLSAVYIGSGWVMTARHVGEADVTLSGIVYPADPGSRITFETSPGVPADLAVYRIVGDPGLPPLKLSATTPSVGDEVWMAGRGWKREANLTYWNAAWTELAGPVGATWSGYKKIAVQRVRWGTNRLTLVGVDVLVDGKTTRSIVSVFDESGGTTDECAVVIGDSGGGVFIKRAGTWELAGISFAAETLPNQPFNTAVFGDRNFTADVAYYHDAIVSATSHTVPSTAPAWILALVVLLLSTGALAFGSRRRRRA
jgi:hypothetical protein